MYVAVGHGIIATTLCGSIELEDSSWRCDVAKPYDEDESPRAVVASRQVSARAEFLINFPARESVSAP